MKYCEIFERHYRSYTSGDPEDRGESYTSRDDNITELLENLFLELTDLDDDTRKFLAQNPEKDLFSITVWNDKPQVANGNYRRIVKVEGLSNKTPEKLLKMLTEKGFRSR